MVPEISHRCSSCGAAVRDADGLFCPECGQPLANEPKDAGSEDVPQVTPDQPEPDESLQEINTAPTNDAEVPAVEASHAGESDSSRSHDEVAPAAAGEGSEQSTVGAQPSKESAAASLNVETSEPESAVAKTAAGVTAHAHRIGDKTRERLHRASAAARGVIEDEVKRVEKIRHVSTTVIEEAHYDPSLRFVLVALGLFVVFVILLVLSKVMG
jgi:hypothetical protein